MSFSRIAIIAIRNINRKKITKIFIDACSVVTKKKHAEAWAKTAKLRSTKEWLAFRSLAYSDEYPQSATRALKNISLQKALECAVSVSDYVALINYGPKKIHKEVYKKLFQFEPSAETIRLFKGSQSKRLRHAGWYLEKQQRHKNT